MLCGYTRLLTHYPHLVLLVVLAVATTSLVVILTLGRDNLQFEEPLAGFEPRGTELSNRLVTYENLVKNMKHGANLLPFAAARQGNVDSDISLYHSGGQAGHQSQLLQTDPARAKKSVGPSRGSKKKAGRNSSLGSGNMFCGVPEKGYSRIVVTSTSHRSLFNVDDLHSICQLEASYLRGSQAYQDICSHNEVDGGCCLAWSLGHYVALLSNKTRCTDTSSEDVSQVHQLLLQCAAFFHNKTLGPNCAGDGDEWYYSKSHGFHPCPGVPEQCRSFNAVYHILHFLTDFNFMQPNALSWPTVSLDQTTYFLRASSIFLPVVAGSKAVDVFKHLDQMPREFGGVQVVGAHFGVKYALFEEYLLSDSVWLGVVCALIFVALWLYTTSVFVTIMSFLSMFWSLEVAYFLYTFVFKIRFFPYMNMVTLFVMLGIGADDLFIFCRMWNLAKSEKNNGVLDKIVSDTLRHTIMSMFVTSLTTAASFYANYISDITALRCFSIFAGTSVIINFILTVTWIPASIMLHEKWLRSCIGVSSKHWTGCFSVCRAPSKLYDVICDWSRIFFEKLLPCFIIKLRYLWIFIFGVVWVCSIVVIFYYPRFKLPSVNKFQVFASDHLLESYDFVWSDLFDFERVKDGDDLPLFPITVVWGVLADDNGDPMDPHNKGSLTFDPLFDLTSPSAQQWILKFCSSLRRSDFYLPFPGIQLTDCFLENFVHRWMKQACSQENVECCNQTLFPFPKSKMISCLSVYIPELSSTPGVEYNSFSPGPRFDNGRISAFFVQFLSNHSFSHSYEEVHHFYTKVDQWVKDQMLEAPLDLKRGWFVSHLHFYDLQSSIALGAPLALGVSLSVVAVVSFFTTLNILISLYALVTVGATISSTLACLVLMGWEMGVLESVVITVAVGLAVDITLHYGVAFRLSPDLGREMRIVNSLSRMGSPVAMAALTTMLAGAFMMPSTVLAYRKFGTFLVLLVSLAWLYATFFFQSLLRTIGPQEGFGQFHWPVLDCCLPGSRVHVDKTVYALSESTLSSSSTSTREHSHGHYSAHRELEPLTDTSSQEHNSCSHHCPHWDSDHSRHHRHHHHHHHRPHRRCEYSSVQTTVSSAEASPLRNPDSDLPSAPSSSLCTNSPASIPSPCVVKTASLASETFTSDQSSQGWLSEQPDSRLRMTSSDSDNLTSSIYDQLGTTRAQIEVSPPCLPLLVS